MMESGSSNSPGHIPKVFVEAPPAPPPARPSVKAFVRGAASLLLIQVLLAGAAIAITGWAAFQVVPLLKQKAQLETDIVKSKQDLATLSVDAEKLKAEQAKLQATLANARQSADFVSRAITQYHNRNYDAAVRIYDQALALDPENSYVLDLKSYSQFRAGDVKGAIATVQSALKFRPDYIYGYSELSRYACAAGDFDLAVDAFHQARKRSPDALSLYQSLLREDGQFATLCRSARNQFAEPPHPELNAH